VDERGLRCAFHGWCFDGEGRCAHAPDHVRPPARRLRRYAVEERWGLIWMFNGPAPSFALPDTPRGEHWRPLRLPSQRIACHPHVVLGNGLDLTHYETLHGMAFTSAPALETRVPYEVTVSIRGRSRSRLWRAICGDVVARFTTIGASIAWTTVLEPIRFAVVFTGRPDRDGHCITQTVFLFPRGTGVNAARAFALMAMLLHDDRRVLDSIDFKPAFTERDAPMSAFADVVDALGTW
jgi:phenylpropionate dioxygenase-like ring-hydroxylating dioxygenase large terminal subunit